MLTNGTLSAADAHLFGLVGRLVEDDELRDAAIALAHEIAAGPVRAMVRTRALVRRAAVRTLEEQLDDEAQLIAESAADPEGREGVRAFLEKRRAGLPQRPVAPESVPPVVAGTTDMTPMTTAQHHEGREHDDQHPGEHAGPRPQAAAARRR